ncbi:hypothetical protein [Streptomyces avermitilis]|uniref:hypothetical protein n=1 Tax=Streptomyces avermitilis TaxID=33903 RepID=UPI00369640B6
MIWRYVPDSGWVLQPLFPAAPGCVVTTGISRGFGFREAFEGVRRALQSFRPALHAVGAVGAVSGLIWLWLAGFPAEVAAAVFAAGIVAGLAGLGKDTRSALRRIGSWVRRRKTGAL